MSGGLDELIAAAPWWRRPGMRVLFALALRPRGLALLRHISPADQAAHGLVALGRYDDPVFAKQLGWDAEAVAARGRAVRETEGRP